MKETDVGIEKESIPFVSTHNLSNIKTFEIEYALSIFRLLIFRFDWFLFLSVAMDIILKCKYV